MPGRQEFCHGYQSRRCRLDAVAAGLEYTRLSVRASGSTLTAGTDHPSAALLFEATLKAYSRLLGEPIPDLL